MHPCFAGAIELFAHPKITLILSFSWGISSKKGILHILKFCLHTLSCHFWLKSMYTVHPRNYLFGSCCAVWVYVFCGLVLGEFTYILQVYFTGTGAIIWLSQYQWINPLRIGLNTVSDLKLYEIQASRACNFIKFQARLESSRPHKSLCQQNCYQRIKNSTFLTMWTKLQRASWIW